MSATQSSAETWAYRLTSFLHQYDKESQCCRLLFSFHFCKPHHHSLFLCSSGPAWPSLNVPVIFCKASGSLSGTARLQNDNSYYTQIHKALVLVHLCCVKGFVASLNWRDTRVTGVNNYKAIANSDLLLLQTHVPAYLLLLAHFHQSGQLSHALCLSLELNRLPCCPGINLPSLLKKWCPQGKEKGVFYQPIRPKHPLQTPIPFLL